MGLGMWSLPASPRWLLFIAVQGKASLLEYKEKAITGLSRLRGQPAGDKKISNLRRSIEATIIEDSENSGEIKSFSTDGWVAPKLSERDGNFMLYMLTAGKKSLDDSGISEEVVNELDKTKCGVLIGSWMGGMKIIIDA
ncbi:hypothetical protein MKW98_028916 [Papaver atlanticum]|uniref:beta-ketoacyl-[acyl-carrier-protein] synthase I n=1 Tax=Papaver atlanticum TaxID=357466 RepID=A0AAD4S2L8_9MAGN|nr:hypothetical protein MKW98_028916 [Papaver atlanticum]